MFASERILINGQSFSTVMETVISSVSAFTYIRYIGLTVQKKQAIPFQDKLFLLDNWRILGDHVQ